jgi:hypothetical protein
MRAILVITSLLISTASFAQGAAPSAPKVQYSADYVMETAEGASRGHIYAAPGVERSETVNEGTTMISIRRDDKHVTWMLMPSERMYMEIKAGQPAPGRSNTPSPEDYKTQMTTEGRETINGIVTTKSKVLMTGADGSKMGGFWWTSDDGLVVKMDVISAEKGGKVRLKRELTNIKIGAQPAELFEIPAGYTAMNMGFGSGLLGIPRGASDDAEHGAKSDDKSDDKSERDEPKKKRLGLGGALKGVLGGR